VVAAKVTPGVFELLGSAPVQGSGFESDDGSCPDCVVLSCGLWRDQFRGDKGIIGGWLFLDGHKVKVVGILPCQFRLPGVDVALYMPFGTGSDPQLMSFEWAGALIRVSDELDPTAAKPELQAYLNRASGLSPKITLDVLSAEDIRHRTWEAYAIFALMVVLSIVILNWPSLIRLSSTRPRHRFIESFKWWSFFGGKGILSVLVALVGSVDLVQFVARNEMKSIDK
jgi:hypothetical protein